MNRKTPPKPSFLDSLEPYIVSGGRKVWRSKDGTKLYTWDSLHGEIEIFNSRGRHLGALDAKTGVKIKSAVKGRKINV